MVSAETVGEHTRSWRSRANSTFVIVTGGPWCTLLGSYRTIGYCPYSSFPLGNRQHLPSNADVSKARQILPYLEGKADTHALWELWTAVKALRPWTEFKLPKLELSSLLSFGGLCAFCKLICAVVLDNVEMWKILVMVARSNEFRGGDRLVCQHQMSLIKLVPNWNRHLSG